MSDEVEGGLSYKGSRPGPWVPVRGERVRRKKDGAIGTVVTYLFSSVIDGRDVDFVRVNLDYWSSRRLQVTMRVDNLMKVT